MNPRNLAETLIPIGLKLGFLVPTVEARFVDGDRLMVSILGNDPHDLNVKLNAAMVFLEANNINPTKGNVLYTSGYRFQFTDDSWALLGRRELGSNTDGGLRMAWAFLGEIQEPD